MSQQNASATGQNPGQRGADPATPTPEDPREKEPIRDPPVDPEHDIDQEEPVRQAEESQGGEVLFDADEVER